MNHAAAAAAAGPPPQSSSAAAAQPSAAFVQLRSTLLDLQGEVDSAGRALADLQHTLAGCEGADEAAAQELLDTIVALHHNLCSAHDDAVLGTAP